MTGCRMYTLYVIPGSHACRSAMLMLRHKGLPYRRVDVVTLTHPVVTSLLGFNAGGQTRAAGGKRTFGLRLGDRLGTVPALAAGKERISTNHGIARFLDERQPDPPLLPHDPQRRAAIEAIESWANGDLQMTARRIPGAAWRANPQGCVHDAADGRMGYLLYKRPWARRLVMPTLAREVFRANPEEDEELLREFEGMLDRIDGWIDEGLLNAPELSVADFMVAPSLALIWYRRDVRSMYQGRAALELLDRLLPEPANSA